MGVGFRVRLRCLFFQKLFQSAFFAFDTDVVNQQPNQSYHVDYHHEVGGEQELALIGHGDQIAMLTVGSKIVISSDNAVSVGVFEVSQRRDGGRLGSQSGQTEVKQLHGQ